MRCNFLITFTVLLVNLSTQGYKMAVSREIPISVHPEFERQTSDQLGKPRIFTRSLSLPCRPNLNSVRETLNPSGFHKKDHKLTASESSSQGTNGTKKNQNYAFWGADLPVDYPNLKLMSEHRPRKLNASEGMEQRRHFFTENPFIGDLEKVFEDQYNSDSRPVKLGRRNTYSAATSREPHHFEPKIGRNFTKRNKKRTSFDIPIQVEFDEIKDCNDMEKESSPEPHHSEPKTGRKFTVRNRKGTSFDIPNQVEFDETENCDGMERKISPEPHHSEPIFGEESAGRNSQEGEFEDVKDENEIKDGDLDEKKLGSENSVQHTEQTTKPILEVNSEKSDFRFNEPSAVANFDALNDFDKSGEDKDLGPFNSESNEEDFAREGNEGKENKCHEVVEDDEQFQRVPSSSLPQDLTEENKSKTKLLTIQSILKKAEELERKVDAFSERRKTKEYLILEEVLTCCLIELDGIETNRDENIRLARKTAVQQLQKTLTRLEQKVTCKTIESSEN